MHCSNLVTFDAKHVFVNVANLCSSKPNFIQACVHSFAPLLIVYNEKGRISILSKTSQLANVCITKMENCVDILNFFHPVMQA